MEEKKYEAKRLLSGKKVGKENGNKTLDFVVEYFAWLVILKRMG